MKIMEPYQERVIEEKKELDEKIEKLAAFIESDAFISVSTREKVRLHRQEVLMQLYSKVLADRIEAFSFPRS
jgi:crAss001_48 related protein